MKPLQNNYIINRSSGNVLRIIFEILVLIHHLYLSSTALGDQLKALFGPLAVGGFVLLSGYGVGINYRDNGEEYSKKLFFTRVPKTYLVLVTVNLCYLALYYAMGNAFQDAFSLIISVLYIPVFSGFVALSHWIYFLADLIIYYILFLILSQIFKNKKNGLLLTAVCMLIVAAATIAILTYINNTTGSDRYLRACICFPIGLMLAHFNDYLLEILKKYKYIIFAALCAVGIALFAFLDLRPVREYLTSAVMVLALAVLFFGVEVKGKIIPYLSGLVLYVYVSHEFFRHVAVYLFPTLHQNVVAIIIVLFSCVFAVIFNAVLNFVHKKFIIR